MMMEMRNCTCRDFGEDMGSLNCCVEGEAIGRFVPPSLLHTPMCPVCGTGWLTFFLFLPFVAI